jgi:hypothetical protein
VGEHPTLIGSLVGIYIAFVAIAPLEDMLEQPGCPNLYWALTNLPNPLVSLERGLDGDRMLIEPELRDLDDRAPMSAEQIERLIKRIDKLRLPGARKPETTRAWLDARNKDEAVVRAARRRLVEYGIPEERLLRFPADQVLILDQKWEYEVGRDEIMKLMNLPTCQIGALDDQVKRLRLSAALFGGFVPIPSKVRYAQGRLEQRIALLRHVEALRLYAAAHDGKLPAKLSDCPVPLPPDPFTGKPFRYRVDGGTAHLRGTPPPAAEKNPAFNVHYEVTVQKMTR